MILDFGQIPRLVAPTGPTPDRATPPGLPSHPPGFDCAYCPTLDALVVAAQAPVSPLTWRPDPRLPQQPVPANDGADYLEDRARLHRVA